MKQSTIGKFFAKPAAAQGAAKPLAPSNAVRDGNAAAKAVRSPEKKRARPEKVRSEDTDEYLMSSWTVVTPKLSWTAEQALHMKGEFLFIKKQA